MSFALLVFTIVFLQDHTTSSIKSICCFPQFPHSNVFLKTNTRPNVGTASYLELVKSANIHTACSEHQYIPKPRAGVSSGQYFALRSATFIIKWPNCATYSTAKNNLQGKHPVQPKNNNNNNNNVFL